MYQIYSKIIKYHSTQSKCDFDSLCYLFGGLNGLSYNKESIDLVRKENRKYDFIKSALDLIKRENFLSEDKLKNDAAFELYIHLLIFFRINSIEISGKKNLVKTDAEKVFVDHINEINDKLSSNRSGLEYAKSLIIMSILDLLNEYELIKLNAMYNDFVGTLTSGLKDCIDNGKQNKTISISSYVRLYKIRNFTFYNEPIEYLIALNKLSSNSEIKQIMFQANLIDLLDTIVQNGQEFEQEKCFELIYSLCFYDKMKHRLNHKHEKLVKLINKLKNDSKSLLMKRYCKQIADILDQARNESVQPSAPVKPEDWDIDDVNEWLISNDLRSLAKVFSRYNGRSLLNLHEIKQKDHNEFCSYVEKEIKKSRVEISVHEKQKFYEKLSDLLN